MCRFERWKINHLLCSLVDLNPFVAAAGFCFIPEEDDFGSPLWFSWRHNSEVMWGRRGSGELLYESWRNTSCSLLCCQFYSCDLRPQESTCPPSSCFGLERKRSRLRGNAVTRLGRKSTCNPAILSVFKAINLSVLQRRKLAGDAALPASPSLQEVMKEFPQLCDTNRRNVPAPQWSSKVGNPLLDEVKVRVKSFLLSDPITGSCDAFLQIIQKLFGSIVPKLLAFYCCG